MLGTKYAFCSHDCCTVAHDVHVCTHVYVHTALAYMYMYMYMCVTECRCTLHWCTVAPLHWCTCTDAPLHRYLNPRIACQVNKDYYIWKVLVAIILTLINKWNGYMYIYLAGFKNKYRGRRRRGGWRNRQLYYLSHRIIVIVFPENATARNYYGTGSDGGKTASLHEANSWQQIWL